MGRQVFSKKVGQKVSKIFPYVISTFYSQNSQQLNMPPNFVHLAINRQFFKNSISRLKLTASQAQFGVLSATQVAQPYKMFVINKNINKQKIWQSENFNNPQNYQYYLNAKILSGKYPKKCTQQNISFPFLLADIYRYSHIQVLFNDIHGQEIKKQLQQYEAFAFQQAWDFSIGRHILDWRLHLGTLRLQQDVRQKLVKTSSVLQQYSTEITKILQKFPNLSKVPENLTQKNINWLQNRNAEDQISIQYDYLIRLHKHYRKQMILFLQRLENNAL